MTILSPEQAEQLREAAFLQSVLPSIQEEIEAMKHTTQTNVFAKLSKGILTPEEALSYWMEMYSYHRLNKRLEAKARPAEAVTETRRLTDGQA